ncbi:CHASE3 domain-containing protein, partial [Singulisphaera rosea]
MTRATFAAGYLFVIAVLLVDAFLVAASVRTILRSYERVDNARQVSAELERTLAILKDAETGQRGYLLTGRSSYLEPLRSAETRFNAGLGRLERLTKENARQRELIADLRVLAAVKMIELRQTVEIRRSQGLEKALEIVLTDRGKEVMEKIVRVAGDFGREEDRLLIIRTAAARSAVRRLVLTFAATTGAAIVLLFAVFLLQWLEGSVREKAASALRRSEAWLSTTLASIGDAVIASDDQGCVRLMNAVASELTGWGADEAVGRPMAVVFTIIDETTRKPSEDPVGLVIGEGWTLAEANHTLLVARDGSETSIENCAAPIKDEDGKIVGVVLVFRDTTERRRQDAFRDEQRRLAEFGRDMGFALSGEGTLPEILGRCTQLTVGRLDSTFSGIWTVGEQGHVELQASTNVGTEAEDAHHHVLVAEPELRRMVEAGHPYLSTDVPLDPLVPAG